MVLSDLTNRSLSSSTASPAVRRAAAGLRLSRNLLETAWVRAINPVREDGDEKTEEEEEVDFLFTLLLVSEELSPGGFAGRALAALETAERRASWSPRRLKDPSRRKFSEVIGLHFEKDPTMFKRYFRMPKDCFELLVQQVRRKVKDDEFRPESSIDHEEYRGAVKGQGGVICGEVRLAVFLRLLAGASYLDLMVIFDLSHRSVFRCFHIGVEWINRSFVFPLVKALMKKDKEYFEQTSELFAMGSDGIFQGVIGAIDGIAIRIRRPTRSDSLPDPGAYYCRKGFHALNCQAVCDNYKRIQWMSSNHQGCTNDSAAFQQTQLYQLLQKRSTWLMKNEFFLVGDSAYALESFMLTPYDKVNVGKVQGQKEDAYNFYHSNCRIRIECAFGELIMRWGIFWRKFQMGIDAAGPVVTAAAHLHNFIIGHRMDEQEDDDNLYFSSFSHRSIQSMDEFNGGNFNEETPVAMVSGTDQPKPRGRPTDEDKWSKACGSKIRRHLCWELDAHNKRRPTQQGFKYNSYGMVYME